MLALDGKVALITGASRGIGAAIALELAAKGAKVVINYLSNEDRAMQLVKRLNVEKRQAIAIQGDIADSLQARVLVEGTVEAFGGIDILVNNAGITRDRLLAKMSIDDWQEVIRTNLDSIYNCSNAVLPYLMDKNGGSIINISSIIGQAGGFGQTNYAAAKAGIIGFTKSAALELANRNITVNAICPGFIETEMVEEMPSKIKEKIISKIPMGRLGRVEEIARLVSYLLLDGQYITGQCLNINGGLYM